VNQLNHTGWWFQTFLGIFTPKIGEDGTHFDKHIFQMGLKAPTRTFLLLITRFLCFCVGTAFLFFFHVEALMYQLRRS